MTMSAADRFQPFVCVKLRNGVVFPFNITERERVHIKRTYKTHKTNIFRLLVCDNAPTFARCEEWRVFSPACVISLAERFMEWLHAPKHRMCWVHLIFIILYTSMTIQWLLRNNTIWKSSIAAYVQRSSSRQRSLRWRRRSQRQMQPFNVWRL